MKVKILIVMLFALLPSTMSQAVEIVLVADPWPPYNMEPCGDQEGYIVDVAREVFDAAGHRVIYEAVPWKRAIEGTRSGQYTGAIGASKTDAEGFVFPDEELSRNYLSFYVRQDSQWRFEGPESINSISIGVAAGYDYRKWMNDYIQIHSKNEKRVQIVTGKTPLIQNLKKLLLKRIDVVVDSEAAIRFTAKKIGVLDKIKPAGFGIEPAYIYIAFSPGLKESPTLAQQLSDGIRELRSSGRLKNILDRYGLLDWKSP